MQPLFFSHFCGFCQLWDFCFHSVHNFEYHNSSQNAGTHVIKHMYGHFLLITLEATGGGGTHILRHKGTFRPFGLVFCKKSLDMGTTFHWKIPRHGSTFSIKAPGHGWPIWLLCLIINLSADCTVKSATYLLISA